MEVPWKRECFTWILWEKPEVGAASVIIVEDEFQFQWQELLVDWPLSVMLVCHEPLPPIHGSRCRHATLRCAFVLSLCWSLKWRKKCKYTPYVVFTISLLFSLLLREITYDSIRIGESSTNKERTIEGKQRKKRSTDRCEGGYAYLHDGRLLDTRHFLCATNLTQMLFRISSAIFQKSRDGA